MSIFQNYPLTISLILILIVIGLLLHSLEGKPRHKGRVAGDAGYFCAHTGPAQIKRQILNCETEAKRAALTDRASRKT